jgi:hypothetical protein
MWGDLGFETIGNATLIVHDRSPILATDPWLDGSAYFGSWSLTNEVPAEQVAAIEAAPYLFISHGHPDHLHPASLARLRNKRVLLADHAGARLLDDLETMGFEVEVLADRAWRPLSGRVRVMAIADPSQDSVLLVDLDGTLLIDANDATDHGWGYTVHRAAEHRTKPVFMLALSGYGDADMINFVGADGARIEPPAAQRRPPGHTIVRRMKRLGAGCFVPFSSMHRYQRDDSSWANAYVTPPDEHQRGFEAPGLEITQPFVRYDCAADALTTIEPSPNPLELHHPSEYGDDWSDTLDPEDAATIHSYFASITTLRGIVGEIVFRIGGNDLRLAVDPSVPRGVTFEVPRHSLVDAVAHQVFDDLLIGNFMRTALHGDWDAARFPSWFSLRVAKYADNGRARTPEELKEYLHAYRQRARFDSLRFALRRRAAALRVRGGARATR